ncbi:ImmA/IrrE family metallo-endopeptidase [Paenibacillus sp. strain BS8-2]
MIFDMTLYRPTELELWICQKYQESGIVTPADLDLDHIADIFCSIVRTTGGKTKVYYDDVVGIIYLNQYDGASKQRADFFHELCHPAMHAGSQLGLPQLFIELQEAQAGAFQQYAAMPYYMLAEIKPCHTYDEYYNLLADVFRLPLPFVVKRIDQVRRRMLQGHHDRNAYARQTGITYRYGYSEETLRVLDKLHQQLSDQRGALG